MNDLNQHNEKQNIKLDKNNIGEHIANIKKNLTELYNNREELKKNIMTINQQIFRLEGALSAYQNISKTFNNTPENNKVKVKEKNVN